MNQFFLILFLGTTLTGLMVFFGKIFTSHTTKGHNNNEIQSAHIIPTPRLGGVSIFITCFLGIMIVDNLETYLPLIIILSALPVFFAGLLDDLSIFQSVFFRYISSIISALIVIFSTNYYITTTSIFFLDYLISIPIIAICFSLFAASGVSNAFNLIDGMNGLSSGIAIIICLFLFSLSVELGEVEIANLIQICGLAIFSFFIWNFPFQKIFLGDNGAYFLGHVLFWIAIILSERNSEISQWAILLFFLYPVIDTIFSIIRRVIRQKGISEPDRLHLHTLIFDKFIKVYFMNYSTIFQNNLSSLITLFLASLPMVTGYFTIYTSLYAFIWVIFYVVIYLIIYVYLSYLKIN